MKPAIVCACVALALAAVVEAQDKKMATGTTGSMAVEKAYSGCVESRRAGTYTLTHSMIADAKGSMKTASSMKATGPTMKSDASRKGDAMAHDAMTPGSLVLSAAAPGLDLHQHVGHRVTVTGTDGDSMNGMATFNVRSVEATGGSC